MCLSTRVYPSLPESTRIVVDSGRLDYNCRMDPMTNPFSPGAGAPPPELVGRGPILEAGRILFGRVRLKRPAKSLLLTGLRGVGKTVLLNELERLADAAGYCTASMEAHEGKPLASLLTPELRRVLYKLDRVKGAGVQVRRAWSVFRSFLSVVKLKAGEVEVGLDVVPEKGTADSGDLEADLPDLLVAIGEAAEARGTAVALLIDEIQYFRAKELGALIMGMHKLQQRQLPLVLLGAGLPTLPALAGESKSYSERLFDFPTVGALSAEDAAKVLRDPAHEAGVIFESGALDEVYQQTQGYPYFVQEWGYQAWNHAAASPITAVLLRQATARVIERLDQNFFRVRYDRLTPGEKDFLRAMAELGPGQHRTGEIARVLGVKQKSLGPRRADLLAKGMIYSPAHGEMAFTVPLFDEFLKRAIPDFPLA